MRAGTCPLMGASMNQRTLNVLFVCAGDCSRAVMAQALLKRFGAARFAAFSAGADPRAGIDPIALELLHHHGFDVGEVRGLQWKDFAGDSAPALDYVICLSDQTEIPGDFHPSALRAMWRITDPAAEPGDGVQRRSAMRRALRELETRVKLFALLRHDNADALEAV